MLILRCAVNLAYYSLSLNVGKFGLNIFLTQLIFGLSEIPVHFLCMWSLETAGRKASLMGALIVGGFLCLLILAVPQSKTLSICNTITYNESALNRVMLYLRWLRRHRCSCHMWKISHERSRQYLQHLFSRTVPHLHSVGKSLCHFLRVWMSVVLMQLYYNLFVDFQSDGHGAGLHSCTSCKYVISSCESAGDLSLHYSYCCDWQPGTWQWDNGLPAARDQTHWAAWFHRGGRGQEVHVA